MENTSGVNLKSCFGCYENFDNSWHCKGCVVQHECAAAAKDKKAKAGENDET